MLSVFRDSVLCVCVSCHDRCARCLDTVVSVPATSFYSSWLLIDIDMLRVRACVCACQHTSPYSSWRSWLLSTSTCFESPMMPNSC